ncbi:DUF4233 domain-containing protein [Gulosibacter sp. 10]|uniref:DUF4233 domain-containing protein n=1 Tax=Gulosibacter sp. 10 TaxID=1255570 RepID=UPI00097EBD70|nr:DUF4233 domain-containing protein [Gulosibacter sp. 10]SJM61914.1 Membrane protein [Gulosibacter sp. 10]
MSRAPRARRYRTMTEQLGSILLAFEVISVALGGLAIFGLKVLPAGIALGGTAVFLVLMVAGVYLLRRSWGRWYVLGLQIALTLAGFIHPSMFFVGGIFLAIWCYCQYQGGRIDAARAVIIAEYEREQAALAEQGEPAEQSGADGTR